MTGLRDLAGYPAPLLASAQALPAQGRVPAYLAQRYPEAHALRSDGALVEYVGAMKARHLRTAPPDPRYHQLEFDTRLWLTARELQG